MSEQAREIGVAVVLKESYADPFGSATDLGGVFCGALAFWLLWMALIRRRRREWSGFEEE